MNAYWISMGRYDVVIHMEEDNTTTEVLFFIFFSFFLLADDGAAFRRFQFSILSTADFFGEMESPTIPSLSSATKITTTTIKHY